MDLLGLTARQLQILLKSNETTSAELVEAYLSQIEKHNRKGMKLNAMISITRREVVMEQARRLDSERAQGKNKLGALHGIPIIIKDTICTPSLDLETTCGSFALRGAKARKNARIVDMLLEAGAIIIGKTNLSEWGSYKGYTSGWSAVGGQTQSPYVRGGVEQKATFLGHSTPGGSSSGSGAGVAAGFAPIAIGTESDGSTVQPATRAALYGMKATLNSVPTDGIQPISRNFDCVGAMAKSPGDLADIFGILHGGLDYSIVDDPSWRGLRLGIVDPDLWQPADFVVEPNEDFTKQTYREMDEAIRKLRAAGADIVQPVFLENLKESEKAGGHVLEDFWDHDLDSTLTEFLANFDNPNNVSNLQDLIEFNEKHSDIEMPPDHDNQVALIRAKASKMTQEEYDDAWGASHRKAVEMVNAAFDDNKVDVIMAPADARMASIAAMASCPVASVPLGYADLNGRAFGMNILAKSGQEKVILQVMAAWEATLKPRKAPPMLVNWKDEDQDESSHHI